MTAGDPPPDIKVHPTSGDDDFYSKFISESHRSPGDHGLPQDQVHSQNMAELDPALIAEGQAFVRRNFFSVMLSHLLFMMMVFGTKFGRIVILHTGNSNDKEASLKRYLATIMRMWERWYDGDFSSPNDGAPKDLVAVRKIHVLAAKTHPAKPRPELPPLTPKQQKVLEALKAEMVDIDASKSPPYIFQDEDPEIPLSQFHMAMGQWGFMAFVVVYPELFGVRDMKGVEGYVHMWSIIGRQLGIEDRFNMALQLKESGGDATELKKIFEHVTRPIMKGSDEWTVLMNEAMVDGIGEYVWPVRFLPLLKLMLVSMKIEGKSLDPLMSLWDKIVYWGILWVVRRWGKYGLTNWLRNWYIRWCLNRGDSLFLTKPKKH